MADFFSRIIDPFVKRNKWTREQQQQHYARSYNIWDHQQDKFGKKIIPGATEMEDVTTVSSGDFQQQTGQLNSFVYRSEPGKVAKLQTWREMSMFPEISFALGEVEDEAINFDANGEFMELVIKNPKLLQNENIKQNLLKEWNYIIYDVMNTRKQINEWFMEFMVDGEIFFEKIVDPATAKERGILRIKRLRPEFTFPIWEEIETDRIFEFIHKNESNILRMPPQMVAYSNSGLYKYPDRWTKDVLSFLEISKINYRMLKQLEDSLIIYRLVRSPERRIFKIEVGKLPKGKAEAYVQSLMRKYRQRKVYDPTTGEASQLIDTMAMIEDFWLPSQDGRGSTVDTLPGGENLGQVEDVLYFLKKLYRALRIPFSRMEQDTGFSLGDTSDITREEVRFNKMVQKFVNRFADVFLQIYMSHLQLKGYADEYGVNEKDFQVKLYSNNLFEDFLETNILSQRAENFERFIEYAEGDEENPPLFDKVWLAKRFLKFSVEDMVENDEYIKIAKQKKLKSEGSSELSSEGGEEGEEKGSHGHGGELDFSKPEKSSKGGEKGGEKGNIDDLFGGEKPGGEESKDKDLESFAEGKSNAKSI